MARLKMISNLNTLEVFGAFACTHMKRERMEVGHGLPGVSKNDTNTSM